LLKSTGAEYRRGALPALLLYVERVQENISRTLAMAGGPAMFGRM